MKLKFYFRQEAWADQISIYLVGEDANGQRFLAEPMELKFTPINRDGSLSSKPTLEIGGFMSREFLPALANGLAESGYRADSTDAGELKATKDHLADMKRLVFK